MKTSQSLDTYYLPFNPVMAITYIFIERVHKAHSSESSTANNSG